MVQRDRWDTYWGPKNNFFNSRLPMRLWALAAAPVEPCPFVVQRGPGAAQGRNYTWLVAYTARAAASRIIGQFSRRSKPSEHELLGNGFQSPRWAQAPAYAAQATTHYQTYPERPPGADRPPKKGCNLGPMAPRSRKKRQLTEGLQ